MESRNRMTCEHCINGKYLDITESIASGDVKHIISVLKRWQEIGYDRLYFDAYNACISLYKYKH